MTQSTLDEQEVRKAYKDYTLQKFKDNCRDAFQKRINLYMEHEDHGVAYLKKMAEQQYEGLGSGMRMGTLHNI